MHPETHLLLLPFILLLLLTCALPSSSDSKNYYRYTACAPTNYTCGTMNFTVGYPFQFGTARPDYCRYPGYYLTCTGDDTLSINVDDGMRPFQVKSIDYVNHLLTLVDPTFAAEACPLPNYNLTINTTLYDYNDRDTMMTIYSCSTLQTPLPAGMYQLPCKPSVLGQYYYYSLDEGGAFGNCVSVSQFLVQTAAVNSMLGKSLSFGDALNEGFVLMWTAGKGWCSDCVSSDGYCGYNTVAKDEQTCYCPDGSAIRTCSAGNHDSSKMSTRRDIFIGAGSGLFLCLCLIAFLLNYKKSRNLLARWKKKSEILSSVESFIQKYGSLNTKWYKYSEVKRMTKSFTHKLGQGGFGIVYKGNLPNGHSVAVKMLTESKGNGEEFINEVASISRTSHVNIVRLLGFCLDGSKRALIYDFMPNGSLERFIFTDKSHVESTLGWEKLFQIVVGVARGLEYLHRGCNTRIVHFDIKPHNILLDKDYCPKISDFGLAKLCTSKESIISLVGARGTIGYIAPEVFSRNFGVVSSKSDVYSYGMMVLEMVGGRKNIEVTTTSSSETYFPQYLYKNIDYYCVEACGDNGEAIEVVRKMILVALWCIQTMPDDRPSMGQVVNMLEGDINDLQLPPKP